MKTTSNFEKIGGVENFYWRRDRGYYVTRVTLNGTRSWKKLHESKEIALSIHRDMQKSTDTARRQGAKITDEFRTLGQLADEFVERMDESELTESSKVGYKAHLKRLREHWLQGSFDTFLVRHVTRDLAFKLREHLSKAATVKYGKPGVAVREGQGYSNTVVNDTIIILRRLVDIAVEKRVLVENPLVVGRGVLRKTLRLQPEPEVPELPDRETMHRIFDEMRVVKTSFPCEAWVARKRQQANDAADLAEFLAYSGARFREALKVQVKFYTPGRDGRVGTLYLPGYKTEAAERTIPVIPPLARLLDRLIVGKKPGDRVSPCNSALVPLRKACERLGLARMTQHHLRHYFATFCIEKTRDIPTVADWLGHNDGGRVLAKVYRHLRVDHSLSVAALCDDADVEQVDFRKATAQSAVQAKTG